MFVPKHNSIEYVTTFAKNYPQKYTCSNMLEALTHINIAQSIFAISILLSQKPLSIVDKLLISWLSIETFFLAFKLSWLILPDYFAPNIHAGVNTFGLLFLPLLYLYTKYLIEDSETFNKKDSIHLVPFGIYSLIIIIVSPYILPSKNLSHHSSLFTIYQIVTITVYLSVILFYGIKTFRKIPLFKNNSAKSVKRHKITYKEIRMLIPILYSFIVIYMLLLISDYYLNLPFYSQYFSTFFYTAFLSITTFRSYQLMRDLSRTRENEKTPYPKKQNPTTYQNSGLKEVDAKEYEKTIRILMQEQKLWRNPEFSIADIATRIEIPQHYITQVLNERIQKNFYTLVNEYRTEEVIRLFQEKKYKDWTLTAIAYEAGFNSKSSFYSFFKKYTGETPSAYRNQLLNKQKDTEER